MDTKWKKWKNRIGTCLFVLGWSAIVICVSVFARQTIKSNNIFGKITLTSQSDYQELTTFKEFVCEKLDTLLTIANGTYIDYEYWDNIYRDRYENSDDYWSLEQSNTYSSEVEDYGYYYPDYNSLSQKEKDEMNNRYFENIDGDLNVLYQITKDGTVLHTNMKQTFNKNDALPEGYNYMLYFDGSKVTITKDGKDVDIYGNGIYDGDRDYSVPGYENYYADESLKNVTVTILVVKTPLQYHLVGRDNDYYYGNLYYYYTRMLNWNKGWIDVLVFGIAGILLLIPAYILRFRGKEYRTGVAAFLNKFWIEGKVLIILAIASSLFHGFFTSDTYVGYIQEWEYYSETTENITTAVSQMTEDFFVTLMQNPFVVVAAFWIIYLLVFDIVKNHKKPINGLIPMIYHTLSVKNLKLDFSKRMIKRASMLISSITLGVGFTIFGIIFLISRHTLVALIFPLIGLVFIVLGVVFYCRTLRAEAADLDMLDTQIDRISKGTYAPEKMPFIGHDFEATEKNLLNIQSGMKTAIEDQLKSEHMKVDLVANVSHDLKTPLTSIISYVKFLKEEENLPDHVKDYITIIDEKSARLNEMVQDVFSISKATSGQLPVVMKVIDFGKLLNQTLADMEEVINRSDISIKSDIEEHQFYITADGQRMYRVCQNLIQNALKYSLKGSRMYISLKQVSNQAVATFMNTSKEELDQTTDFSARFVRGDKSRTDGGSGLGLSIAKSFTEACGGQFTISINGDMFIVTVAFDQQEAPVEIVNMEE